MIWYSFITPYELARGHIHHIQSDEKNEKGKGEYNTSTVVEYCIANNYWRAKIWRMSQKGCFGKYNFWHLSTCGHVIMSQIRLSVPKFVTLSGKTNN